MKFVHVASLKGRSTEELALEAIIAKTTGSCLCSIIHGLKQQDFGLHTLMDTCKDIRAYKSSNMDPFNADMFTDSGGYSIIVGMVPPALIPRFMDCYKVYVEDERDVYTRIFSLDIPFSVNYPSMNRKEIIYALNKKSLQSVCDLLDRYPELREKLFFVWHFKMLSQYSIWKTLFEELEIGKRVRNWAIGGMVGMRSVTKFAYSPFTAITFRCLLDYMTNDDFSYPFRLHLLGMYLTHDRFQIALLEAMFTRYLSGVAQVEMSYDSINPSHSARMNAKRKIFNLNENGIECYDNVLNVPPHLLQSIYSLPENGKSAIVMDMVLESLERRKKNQRLENAGIFAPVSIHSNLNIDRFYAHIIQTYELLDIMETSFTATSVLGRLRNVLDELKRKYPDIFNEYMCKCVRANVLAAFECHKWFVNRRDYESLDALLVTFIKNIGFPEGIY